MLRFPLEEGDFCTMYADVEELAGPNVSLGSELVLEETECKFMNNFREKRDERRRRKEERESKFVLSQ